MQRRFLQIFSDELLFLNGKFAKISIDILLCVNFSSTFLHYIVTAKYIQIPLIIARLDLNRPTYSLLLTNSSVYIIKPNVGINNVLAIPLHISLFGDLAQRIYPLPELETERRWTTLE